MGKNLFILVATLIFLNGCVTVQAPENGDVALFIDSAMKDETVEIELIYGSWVRTATYLDKSLENMVPANLIINTDGSYTSATEVCSTSGTQMVESNNITITMNQSNCPGNLQLPLIITYQFLISEDGEAMTMTTANIREDYVRAE